MYIERFQNPNQSFTRGSTPSSNSKQTKPKVTRLNKSLNKIHNKSENQEKLIKQLQKSLIGHYDSNDQTEQQQKNPYEDIQNGNFRQIYNQQNKNDYVNSQQQQNKINIDNIKITQGKQKLTNIYKQIPKNGQNNKKIDQKFKDKSQEIKQIMSTHETINSNVFKQRLEQLSNNSTANQNSNEKNNSPFAFYEGSQYNNPKRNITQKIIDCNNNKNTSFYIQQRSSDGEGNYGREQIKYDNIGNIKTITSTKNVKQDNLINTSFYNNLSRPSTIICNRNLNQSFSNQPLDNSFNISKKMNYSSLSNTIQQNAVQNSHLLMKTENILKLSDKKLQKQININNNQILKMNNEQTADPLNQLDELKQIIKIEQQNIQQILQIGNRILQPKSTNLSNNNFKETKSSVYQKQDLSIQDINKEGLLGAYEEYNKLSKHEIIEKLLVSEHIMKQLYKKTKQFQDEIQQLSCNQQNEEIQQESFEQ